MIATVYPMFAIYI